MKGKSNKKFKYDDGREFEAISDKINARKSGVAKNSVNSNNARNCV